MVLTANAHFAIRRIRAGSRLAFARRQLRLRRYHVGLNDWYAASDGRIRAVLKVRRGTVQEVGIADRNLTAPGRATAAFLRSFPLKP